MDLTIINKNFRLLTGLLFLLISACNNSPYRAPVNDVGSRPGPSNIPIYLEAGETHRVNAGETLYAIAWMYDLDYSALARKNKISSPYVIYPGQLLSLETASAPSASVPSSAPVAVNSNRTSVTAPRQTNSSPAVQTTGAVSAAALLRWAWPSEGNIIGRFSSSKEENKGIDIAGKEGDKVLAAEAGEVVYAGSGLLHYGDLIIIKHNAQYLSAYAHNSQLTVKEGDTVTRGQQIAALGSTGINRDMLHFEIRLEGKPVDPLRYLPPRQ